MKADWEKIPCHNGELNLRQWHAGLMLYHVSYIPIPNLKLYPSQIKKLSVKDLVHAHIMCRYGHVSRSSGLAKTILQGTVKGGRRQDRQRKRWEDNIREWTGLEFGKSQRAVENREKWRKLVAKSSVVPQRPSRLRD